MTNGLPLKCFLGPHSAAEQADADAVVAALQDLTLTRSQRDYVLPGQAIAPTIIGALRAADFICLIWGEALRPANVTFEAGLAIGLGKPVLALSPQPGVPFDIGQGVQVIRLKSGDLSPVLSDIRRFIRHMRPKIETSPNPPLPDRTAVEKARAEAREGARR